MINCVQRKINLKKKVHIKKRVDIKKKPAFHQLDFQLDDSDIITLFQICASENISPSTAVKHMINKFHKIHYESIS